MPQVLLEVCGSKKSRDFLKKFSYIFNDIYPALIHNRCIQARGIDDCYNLVLKFVGYFVIYFKHKAWNVFPNYEMYGDL